MTEGVSSPMAGVQFERCWYVYLLECSDGSIYTGVAVDVQQRFAAHLAGKGARYTRAHPPVRVLAQLAFPDRSSACQAEHQIKQWPVARKRALALSSAG